MNSTNAADTKGTAYLRSRALRPGVTNLQIWKSTTGEERTKPPNNATLTRKDSPSSGEVTKRLQLPLDPNSGVAELTMCCAGRAATLHSGRSKTCRIGS